MPETLQVSRTYLIDELISRILRHEKSLSYSALVNFRESPKDFISYSFRDKAPTDAMLYGQMVHCFVLEPDEFEKRFFVIDNSEICKKIGGARPTATNAYKEWVKEQKIVSGERTLVSPQDFRLAQKVRYDVINNRSAAAILELCPLHEQKIEWEYANYKFKGFKDGDSEFASFDLKTCRDANPNKFLRDIWYDWYYGQGAMYQSGTGDLKKPYYIIAADQKGGVSCHELSRNIMLKGYNEFKELVEKFSECIIKDAFNQSYDFHALRWDGIYNADKHW